MKLTWSSPTTVNPKNWATFGYFAAFVTLGLAAASLGPTLPGLARHTGTQLSGISFLFVARSMGYLLGALQGGRLYDRLAGHTVMGISLLVMVALTALVPLLPLLWLLTLVLLLLGVAEGTLHVGGNTLLVWLHGHRVGPFMNAMHFFFGVGAFLAPIIVAQTVLFTNDITWAYWSLALLMLPVVFWLLSLPSPPIRHASAADRAGPANTPLVGLIATFLGLYVGAEVSFGGWIFTYTVALDLASATAAAFLTSAFWGALTVGRLLTIPIAARSTPGAVLTGNLAGCLASVGVILFWQNSLTAVWLGTLGMGLAMASVFPVTLSLAERRLAITGRVTGWFFAGASMGAMIVPWLIGQLFETVGPVITMFMIAADLAAAVIIFVILLFYANRGQERPHDR